MLKVNRDSSYAFTLAEIMLTLALVALLYTMVTTILVQISRYVRSGREVAEHRLNLMREVETLRYQLRSLYVPSPSEGLIASGLIGAKSPVKARDTLRFYTTKGRRYRGVVEVGYKIDSYVDEKEPEHTEHLGLFYREFPFRTANDMRLMDEMEDGPWQLVLKDADRLLLAYSATGDVWQQEWSEINPPRAIRVQLYRTQALKDHLDFEVTPVVGSGRW